jgi:KamA family protein
VIPERVTDELVRLLCGTRLTPIVVVHLNHANELDQYVAAALAKLANAGIPLLNQAVLLRGVNDTTAAQAALCERLVDHRVLPYYLHQLDRVAGAAHFEVPVETGRQIIAELRERLPGYAVPRFVAEIPAAAGKTILS